MTYVHWYYPSSIIPCGLNIDYVRAEELTCVRAEVTCPTCAARLQADKLICAACRWTGKQYDSRDPRTKPNPFPHTCDPKDRGAA